MSLSASRAVWRQTARLPGRSARRFESTATKAHQSAEAAKESASKASEVVKDGASKASEAAKNTASKASEAAKDTASKASDVAKDTASKASEKASDFKSKASEGLTKVSSSAGPAIGNAAKSVSNTLGKIGGRTGKLIAFVERQIPPTVYYARVGGELARLVFQGQKMTPPPVSTFQAYFQRAIKGIRNPQSLMPSGTKSAAQTPEGVVSQVRGVSNAQMAAGAVLVAELLGFFTVGEMIGRFKLVGYRGDTGAAHH